MGPGDSAEKGSIFGLDAVTKLTQGAGRGYQFGSLYKGQNLDIWASQNSFSAFQQAFSVIIKLMH
jgi:hypothetical protein